MLAAQTKVTTPNATMTAAVDEDGVSNNARKNAIETNCALIASKCEEKSPFCSLPSEEVESSDVKVKSKVPFENSNKIQHLHQNVVENPLTTSLGRDSNEFPKDHIVQSDDKSTIQLSPGLSLLQQTAASSSPPPHSYRHSRAYRHFKNPPQPHMCIRTTTEVGEELFINVLSWTRIVIPQEPSDPIPLYGGMRVPPGSPRSPAIVFAVMANPEVLKDSGRHSKDPEERRAMVELMCDFVEAMNPGIKLVRNAVILKDRDISGELKDVWNAVQAQRDREREEQMLLQRQHHFQNFTNTSTNGGTSISNSSLTSDNNSVTTITHNNMFSKTIHSAAVNDAILMSVDDGTPPRSRKSDNISNIDVDRDMEMIKTNNVLEPLPLLTETLDNNLPIVISERNEDPNNKPQNTSNSLSNGNNSKDSTDKPGAPDMSYQLNAINCNKNVKKDQLNKSNGSAANCISTKVSYVPKAIDVTINTNTASSLPSPNPPTTIASIAVVQQAPTKKEKLGGFLPNGCIFPRFTKNSKHKDKDKEPKIKDKEKNILLGALKKSKDKKFNLAANASSSDEKNTSSNSKSTAANCNNSSIKHQKNCLQQLECGVQKLDMNNHHHSSHIVENNINNTAAATISNNAGEPNKVTSTPTSNTGSVH